MSAARDVGVRAEHREPSSGSLACLPQCEPLQRSCGGTRWPNGGLTRICLGLGTAWLAFEERGAHLMPGREDVRGHHRRMLGNLRRMPHTSRTDHVRTALVIARQHILCYTSHRMQIPTMLSALLDQRDATERASAMIASTCVGRCAPYCLCQSAFKQSRCVTSPRHRGEPQQHAMRKGTAVSNVA
jgi:hypothetical protein